MPVTASGQPMMGFSNPNNFFFGFSPSNLYQVSGLGWSIKETPAYNTLSADTPSGRDVRVPLYQNPLHSWKLVWNFLEAQTPGYAGNPTNATDFQALYSFFNAMNGKFGEFLYQPRDSAVVGQELSLPDSNGYVELVHSLGPFFAESVQELNGATPTIFLNDTNITSSCLFYAADSVAPYSGIVFTTTHSITGSPPPVLTANYDYFYRCHFDADKYTFEEFMYQLMKTGIGMDQVRI
jgi:hypothetical protein